MLDFFKKKKEPVYDVTNLSIHDLDFGFILDYDMKSWVVKEVYEYDWGNNNFTMEYKIDSGDEVAFLGIEDDDELTLTLMKPMKIRKIEEDILTAIAENESPPDTIHFENEVYYLDSDSAGYFRNCAKETKDWQEFISWDYYTEDEDKIISIEQWGDRTFEASNGIVLETHEISNIIPGS